MIAIGALIGKLIDWFLWLLWIAVSKPLTVVFGTSIGIMLLGATMILTAYVIMNVFMAQLAQLCLNRSKIMGSLFEQAKITRLWMRLGFLVEFGMEIFIVPQGELCHDNPHFSTRPLVACHEVFIEVVSRPLFGTFVKPHIWSLVMPLINKWKGKPAVYDPPTQEAALLHIKKMEINELHVSVEVVKDKWGGWHFNWEDSMGGRNADKDKKAKQTDQKNDNDDINYENDHEKECDIRVLLDVLTIRNFIITIMVHEEHKEQSGMFTSFMNNTIGITLLKPNSHLNLNNFGPRN